jgi:glutathione reductase (NADPH)
VPQFPGSEHAITSDGFFDLDHLPKRTVVVGSCLCCCCFWVSNNTGAGYIGVELAGILNALGSEVTLVNRDVDVYELLLI